MAVTFESFGAMERLCRALGEEALGSGRRCECGGELKWRTASEHWEAVLRAGVRCAGCGKEVEARCWVSAREGSGYKAAKELSDSVMEKWDAQPEEVAAREKKELSGLLAGAGVKGERGRL